jgi:hypothetical protein
VRHQEASVFKILISLAAFVLLVSALPGCMPVATRVSNPDRLTPTVQDNAPATARPSPLPSISATLPAPTVVARPTTAVAPTASLATAAATSMPPAGWKAFTSAKHHYVVNYPADWSIDVQTGGGGRDPEYVYLRSPGAGLPQVQILALKDVPPIVGFENCDKNLQFRGVPACSISLPKAQIPATQLLIFQKGESHYQLAMQYEAQQQLGVFDDIVRSFQFTP